MPRGNSNPYKVKMDRSPDSYRIAPVQSKLQLTPDTNPNAPDSYHMQSKPSKKNKKKQMYQQAQQLQLQQLKQQQLQQQQQQQHHQPQKQQQQQQQQQKQQQQQQHQEDDGDKPMGRNEPEDYQMGPIRHRQRSMHQQSNRPFKNNNYNNYNNYNMPQNNHQYERQQPRKQQQPFRPPNGFPIENDDDSPDSDRVLLPRRKQQLRLLKQQQQQQKQKQQQQQPQFHGHPHQQQQNYNAFPFQKHQGNYKTFFLSFCVSYLPMDSPHRVKGCMVLNP